MPARAAASNKLITATVHSAATVNESALCPPEGKAILIKLPHYPITIRLSMWDERYRCDEYVYGTEPNQFLHNNFRRITGRKVLCLAEGEGRNAVFLARQGYEVTAVDGSAEGRKKALKLADKYGVKLQYDVADLASYDFGVDRWDGIVSIFCHLPPALRQSVHMRVARALREGGVLLLEAYTPAQLKLGTGGPKDEAMMMTARNLEKELHSLHFTHLAELRRPVLEGFGHTGTGAVVQAIANRE